MLKFTLLRTLYFETDPSRCQDAEYDQFRDQRFHVVPVHFEAVPSVTKLTTEERFLPYSTLYYLYINDERRHVEPDREDAAAAIFEFFRQYRPEFIKEGMPEHYQDQPGLSIYDCFRTEIIPDYRPSAPAFPDTLTVKDLHDPNYVDRRQKYGFPGIELSPKYARLRAQEEAKRKSREGKKDN